MDDGSFGCQLEMHHGPPAPGAAGLGGRGWRRGRGDTCAGGCTHRVVQAADRGLHLRRRDARVPGASLDVRVPETPRRRYQGEREVTVAFARRHGRGASSSATDAAGERRRARRDDGHTRHRGHPSSRCSAAWRCAATTTDGNTHFWLGAWAAISSASRSSSMVSKDRGRRIFANM